MPEYRKGKLVVPWYEIEDEPVNPRVTDPLKDGKFWSGEKEVTNGSDDPPVLLVDTPTFKEPRILGVEVVSDTARANQPTQVGAIFTMEIGVGRYSFKQYVGSRVDNPDDGIPTIADRPTVKHAKFNVFAQWLRIGVNNISPFVQAGRKHRARVTCDQYIPTEWTFRGTRKGPSYAIAQSATAVNLVDPELWGQEHRRMVIIDNQATDILYVRFDLPAVVGSGFRIFPNERYELPQPMHQDLISGIWAAGGAGQAWIQLQLDSGIEAGM